MMRSGKAITQSEINVLGVFEHVKGVHLRSRTGPITGGVRDDPETRQPERERAFSASGNNFSWRGMRDNTCVCLFDSVTSAAIRRSGVPQDGEK
jgi:hypothetical protein